MHSEYEDKEVTRIEKEEADKYRRNLRRKIENIGYTHIERRIFRIQNLGS